MNVEMSDVVFLGILLVVGAVALIAGAGLGAYTAFRQTKDEEEKAWDNGYNAGSRDAVNWTAGLESERTENPHRSRGPFPRSTKKGVRA
ncbi:hypothetical protein PBI_DEWDROP_122 [Microbacterium phage Dewdrop]|nr:hypothetical protein PBI_LEAF_122 [Microbacterium phage Leaf]QGZ17490.1 hypothetical protein PBI_DEWDROP_122 [Microbacterium phage Dewdrop]